VKLSLLLMALGLVLLALSAAPPALAATLNVNSLGDESDLAPDGVCMSTAGTCTLRAAIQEANSIAGVDTITFSVTGTILLTGALPSLNQGVLITGPGAALLTIDANSNGTIFTAFFNAGISGLTLTRANNSAVAVNPGSWTVLDGVVLTNNSGPNGGAVSATINSRLTILNSTLSNNATSGNGGAVYIAFGNAVFASNIENTTIENNQAVNGGGIWNGRTMNSGVGLQLISDTIRNNTATGNGGGLYSETTVGNLNNRVEVTGGAISNNGALKGAGIWNGSQLTVTSALINGNVASGDAGGINSDGKLILNSSTVSGNTAVNGGGVLIGSHQFQAGTIEKSTISGNTASGRGGGMFVNNTNGQMASGDTTVTNSTISGNQAASGGGFSVEAFKNRLNLSLTTIANNAAPTGSGLHTTNTVAFPIVTSTSTIISNPGTNCSLSQAISSTFTLVSDNSCGISGSGNLPNTPANLGPLANNGGPTQTHALLLGSAALDAKPAPCPQTLDQRNLPRPQPPACDLGAFELQVPFLAPPSGVSAQLASPTSVNLLFTDNTTEETSIEIERKVGVGSYSLLVSTGGPLPGAQSGWYYPDSGLGAGQTYCYRLRARFGNHASAYSNESCIDTATSLPAPSNVSAAPDGPSTINVIFTDNATTETGIEIERKLGSAGAYAVIVSTNTPLAGAQSGWYYADGGLSASTQYCYRMRAKDGSNYSPYSNVACGTTVAGSLPAPSGVAIINRTANSLTVLFTDNASSEDGIEIERKTGTGGTYALVVTTAALPGSQSGWYWPDSGLTTNTIYCYRLRTKQGTAFSAYASEACASTTGGTPAVAAPAVVEAPGSRRVPDGPARATGQSPSNLPPGAKPIPLGGTPPTSTSTTTAPPPGSKLIPVDRPGGRLR
jgi:CSLREA domain-containing protein